MKILRVFALCFIVLSSCYGAFDEDSYLFEAIEYEAQKEFDKARDLYLVLYEETKKLEYFKEAISCISLISTNTQPESPTQHLPPQLSQAEFSKLKG